MWYLIVVVILVAIVMYLRALNRFYSKTPWQHFFDNYLFPAEDFFEKVEAAIKERELPSVSFGRESFLQTHILSSRREYLRITRNECVYFVCAAPFGTGTFVSWWLCEKKINLFDVIPFVGKMFGKDRTNKSFYQIDVDVMYRSAVHTAIMSVLDTITQAGGVRGLTEMEKQFTVSRK